jgi:hypothetical protein
MILNPSDLSFNGQEAKDIGEAVIESIFENPAVADLMTVYDGIVTKKQIPFLGTLSKITKLDEGCGSGVSSNNIPMTQKFWEPENLKIWLQLCAEDLINSFWVYAQKLGMDRSDVTGTTIASFVVERMTAAAQEDLLRIIWFNDKAAENVVDGGVIKNGVSLSDYTIINGLWKQIFSVVAGNAARKVAISENAAVSKVLQLTLAANKAFLTFQKLMQTADSRLKSAPDKIIICTTTLLENYAAYLESQGMDASFIRIENGYSTLRYRNVTIYGMDFWDRTIQSDFDNGTTYDLPHRALLTTKMNLAVGSDKLADAESFKVYYSEDTELNNFKGKYRVDAKLLQDYLIQVAY